MLSQRAKELLNELGTAVNEAFANDEHVGRLIARLRAENYDIVLALETTVSLNNSRAGKAPEHEPKSTRRLLSPKDQEFLRSLHIEVDEPYLPN
jgi:hypothetical protein